MDRWMSIQSNMSELSTLLRISAKLQQASLSQNMLGHNGGVGGWRDSWRQSLYSNLTQFTFDNHGLPWIYQERMVVLSMGQHTLYSSTNAKKKKPTRQPVWLYWKPASPLWPFHTKESHLLTGVWCALSNEEYHHPCDNPWYIHESPGCQRQIG